MSWTTPKTDWSPTSRWDKTDVNRIQDNLMFLRDHSSLMFNPPNYASMRLNLDYTDDIYASDFNKITQNTLALNEATFKFPVSEFPVFVANGGTPTDTYLNGIESLLEQIKDKLDTNISILNRLPVVLGNTKGVKT